jgi:penicillin-insensitive murein endopeptidase
MLKKDSLYVDPKKWTPAHEKLLKRAASYPEVQRIFVHPGIKKAMCDGIGADASNAGWMRKLRPYYGHHYHFHIRMACPPGSPNCRPQDATPAGSGCDKSLDWWFTSEPWAPKKPKPGAKKPAKKRDIELGDLPGACSAVLKDAAPADESLVTLTPGYNPELARATAVPVAARFPGQSRMPVIVPIPADRPN